VAGPPSADAGNAPAATSPRLRDRFAALANLPPALRLLASAAPGLLTVLAASRTVAALLPFGTLFVSKHIIDLVVAVTSRHEPVPAAAVWWLLAAGFALAAAALVVGRATDYLEARVGDQFSRTISLRVLQHAAALDLQAFEDATFYDQLERARVQATDRTELLTSFGSSLQRLITLVSLAASIAYYSPILLVVLVACLVPSLAAESEFAVRGYAVAHQLTPLRRELDYILLLGSSRESAKEVKMFGLADHFRDRYLAASDQLLRINRDLARRRLFWGALFATIGSAGYYGSYAYLVWRAFGGAISVGTLTFLTGAIAGSQGELTTLFSLFSLISQQALFLGDLLSFLHVRPRILSPAAPRRPSRPAREGIVFEHVSFAYPGGPPILTGLDLTIPCGEHIALVGENGAGKTTIVKLLARLYDPTDGRILFDGVDLREYDVESLRAEIGVIFQDFFRYDLPVRENVGAGKMDLVGDDPALWDALRKSGADDLVSHLPRGLEQMLGRRFEGGVDLSGGQWQSMALARAYLRNAQILILDEPTAALDARAEADVFEAFAELTNDRTALLISHRFSTVRMAARIVVLDHGKIAEEGSHQDLVAAGGEYARLFELQAANYR
jgi:ATP-binding cassette subfamily B protein